MFSRPSMFPFSSYILNYFWGFFSTRNWFPVVDKIEGKIKFRPGVLPIVAFISFPSKKYEETSLSRVKDFLNAVSSKQIQAKSH